jgi:hypothetical protein
MQDVNEGSILNVLNRERGNKKKLSTFNGNETQHFVLKQHKLLTNS